MTKFEQRWIHFTMKIIAHGLRCSSPNIKLSRELMHFGFKKRGTNEVKLAFLKIPFLSGN